MRARTMKRKTVATEQRVAAQLGGRRVFASGAGPDKGDVRVDYQTEQLEDGTLEDRGRRLAVESKRSFTRSYYTLSATTWVKIATSRFGATPIMHIRTLSCEMAVVPTSFLKEVGEPVHDVCRFDVKSIQLTRNLAWMRVRFVLTCAGKSYDVCALPWDDFLELVTAPKDT